MLPMNWRRWCTEMGALTCASDVGAERMRPFVVEVRTEEGRFARYHAIASSSCAALVDALEAWGIAKISVSPVGGVM